MEIKKYSLRKVKTSIVLNIIIFSIISLAILAYSNFYTQNLYSIAVTSGLLYTTFFITWFKQCKDRFNYYTIFLLFTYIFYFGQFLLILIGVEFQSNRTILGNLLSYDKLLETGVYIENFMVILHFGVLFSTLRINSYFKIEDMSLNNNSTSKKLESGFKKVAMFLFIISIIPTFIVMIRNIQITFSQGYGAIFKSVYYTSGGFNNILRFISQLTIPSLLMLLIAFKDNKKIKIINLFLFIYLVLYFLSGSRLSGVLVISALLLIKHYWYKPFTKKTIAKLGAFIILSLIILNLISAIRNSIYISNDLFSLLRNTIENILETNPLFLALEEAGYTFLAIATVVSYSPSVVPFNYGLSYINSMLALIPNLFWDVHPATISNTDIVFSGFLTNYGGIGSSFIAEAYYNFGIMSLMLAMIFGLLIGTLTKKIIKYSKEKNTMKFYLYIYLAQFSLLYVRSDTVSFWRNFVYYGIIPIFITILLTKKNLNKDNLI